MKYRPPSLLLLLAVGFSLLLPPVAGADQAGSQSQVKDSNPTAPTPSGSVTDPATEERFRILESKIDQLEKQNADLIAARDAKVDSRLDDLARQVSYNYPDAYEKAALNFTIIGTYVTIAITLAGVVYAFITLARTRTTNRTDARKQAIDVVNGINNFLTGRFSNTIALILSEIAWDQDRNPVISHLTEVAVRYQKDSYEAFRKKSCPEFAHEISEWTLKSLNNLVFMLSTTPGNPEGAHIHEYATELRNRPEFWKHSIVINTYTFALMVFRDDLAQKRNVPVSQIMAEARELLVIQQGKDLTQSSLKELDRLIDFYDNLQNNQTDDSPTTEEAAPGAESTTETVETTPTEPTPPASNAPAAEGGIL